MFRTLYIYFCCDLYRLYSYFLSGKLENNPVSTLLIHKSQNVAHANIYLLFTHLLYHFHLLTDKKIQKHNTVQDFNYQLFSKVINLLIISTQPKVASSNVLSVYCHKGVKEAKQFYLKSWNQRIQIYNDRFIVNITGDQYNTQW